MIDIKRIGEHQGLIGRLGHIADKAGLDDEDRTALYYAMQFGFEAWKVLEAGHKVVEELRPAK